MTLSEFISKVNYAVRGLDDDSPAPGSEDWNYWVSVLNTKKDELYRDISKQWDETYEVIEVGDITADPALSFELDDNVLNPSDTVYVIDDANVRHDFRVIKPQERNELRQEVFIAGLDPKTLYFTGEIKADDGYVGGTLFMPAYVLPDDIDPANVSDTIPLPDPYWGVYSVASEVAASDLSYEDKQSDLQARANNLFSIMTKNSRRGTYNNARKTPTNVKRIGQRQTNK